MKSDVMPSIVQMDKEVLKTLLSEVKETVADVIELPGANKQSFGVVDMWFIRKNAKSTSSFLKR